MKIKDLMYKTPEMTEEKLLKIIESHLNWIKKDLKERIITIHLSSPLISVPTHYNIILKRVNNSETFFQITFPSFSPVLGQTS